MLDNLWGVIAENGAELEESAETPVIRTPTVMRDALFSSFRDKLIHNLVSFQANKQAPFYSWFKYREGFSRQLVHYLLQKLMPQPGALLDPFAGAGSALFAASELGWSTQGIEVLPVGVYAMKARMVAERIDAKAFKQIAENTLSTDFSKHYDLQYDFKHLAITKGAFPSKEEEQLVGYISYCNRHILDEDVRLLLLYASFCILEDISYTRKDGQYLRWDSRSGRSLSKKNFSKGNIFSFREAITNKLHQIIADLTPAPAQSSLFIEENIQKLSNHQIDIQLGSCLDLLPRIPTDSIDFVLTSPPYANRYDYTRTYALELVYLGCGDEEVKRLRQTMLSCTVENRDKRSQIQRYYEQLGRLSDFQRVDSTFHHQAALQEVLSILNSYREAGSLNNSHIARLVHNYFYEMCFVIFELARLLRSGGMVAMVNDNVRYAGEEVPVDLILSDMAETFGLKTRFIWTLGRGKGNSSQQMGSHGRTELRKCVYVWEK